MYLDPMQPNGPCELCGREVTDLTRHHLFPVERHRKLKRRNRHVHDTDELPIAWFCRACHRMVHTTLSTKELARDYDTVAKIAAEPAIARFVDWIRKHPNTAHLAVRGGR
jgi:hypothetical protein